ncbi:MAG: DUF3854 domain-containing protein [Dolichospermum sp. UKL201]|jgi:predicted P-loop ATPase|nr:MAG: DUF3854 domain-containing protein [Dolichospermum sp. UKL201]
MTVATLEKQDIYCAISNTLLERHYQELKESAIDDEIIRLNFCSVLDDTNAHKILNRRKRRKWNNPEPLVPAWMCGGVDPLTGITTLSGIQLKLDNPRKDEKGKIIKYESASKFEAAPLFLKMPDSDYWEKIIKDLSRPILITEGVKKAASLLTHGYTAISLPGVSTCVKLSRLHQDVQICTQVGRKFYICFDNDILHKEPVRKALIKLAGLLTAKGCVCYIIVLPEGTEKGADDYLKEFGKDNFDSLVQNASTVQEWLEETKEQDLESEEFSPKSKLAKQHSIVAREWGDKLRYNILSKEVELEGRNLDEDEVRLMMALQFDMDVPKSDALTIVGALAKGDTYSPVVEYLEEVKHKHQDIDTSFLDDLAYRYFGTKDPLHAIYFKKFLISAVKRARQPGCQKDEVFMLISPEQGKGKSTFFKTLFGEDFFSDQLGADISSKDEKMKISQYWCLEWAEIENVYRKKDVSTLKNFITNPTDTFRAPYDRKDKKHPRPCVFVGTSNLIEILHDPTGDRRFWIIEVTVPNIPLDIIRSERDKIWAAANKLYESGEMIYLTKQEEKERDIRNEEYRSTSVWDEVIENYWVSLARPNFLATQDILRQLGFTDYKDMRSKEQAELANSMTRLGFRKTAGKRIDGIQRRGWEKIISYSSKYENSDQEGAAPAAPAASSETIDNSTFSNAAPPAAPPAAPAAVPVKPQNTTEENQSINNLLLHPDAPPAAPPAASRNQIEARLPENAAPVTPLISENKESEENSNKVVDKFACPPKDNYYNDFPSKPFSFTIPSAYGDISVVAEPYAKVKSTKETKIWFVFYYPDGKGAKSIIGLTDKKHLERLARSHDGVKNWHNRQQRKFTKQIDNQKYKFKVRKLNTVYDESDYIWHENCTLHQVPNPPLSHEFFFKSEDGRSIVVLSVNDFELMEN